MVMNTVPEVPMKLTVKEAQVVNFLRGVKVATAQLIQGSLSVSRMTVFRGLNKAGYYSSFNFNSSFLTLSETPQFDEYGLWFHKKVGFSRYGTLKKTLKVWVDASNKGCMANELKARVGTDVYHPLSQLLRQKQIKAFHVGRRAVYVSADVQKGQAQQAVWEEERAIDRAAQIEDRPLSKMFPDDLDGLIVLEVFREMVRRPEASVASVSRRLQNRGVRINAKQIRDLIAFYSLEKKTIS
jgi:hypothetical protein